MLGLSYPWIAIEALFQGTQLRQCRAGERDKKCSWQEFLGFLPALRRELGPDAPLTPGTRFGTYSGRVLGEPEDFVLPDPFVILAKRSAIEALKGRGLKLTTFDIELRGNSKGHDLVELWAPAAGTTREAGYCPECQRGSVVNGREVDSSTIPSDLHCFRLKNAPNSVVFSEAMKEAVHDLGLRGMGFLDLRVR